MAFVNEYIPKEDVEKYGIAEIMAEMDPSTIAEPDPDFNYMWTVDRERESYLIEARVGQGGQAEYSSQVWFVFYLRGDRFTAVLRAGLKEVGEKKWVRLWDLERIIKVGEVSIGEEEYLTFLREALIVHGYDGVRKQYEGYSVECKFYA